MIVDGENISYKVNDVDLGVVFTSKLLLTTNCFASVFITDIADQV